MISQTDLNQWQALHDPSAVNCIICNQSIWYENTKPRILSRGKNKGNAAYSGTSYKTTKTIDNVKYPIKICSKCLCNEIPEYKNVNKSRILNTLNKYVSFVFKIPMNVINSNNKKRVPTLDNLIAKYGESIGTEKWEGYKEKQSYSNSFEYKQKHLGWTIDQYNEYNKSRGITHDNLIAKYGESIGTEKWEEYKERQSYTKSKCYVVNKYGIEYWNNLCKSKANTVSNFIKRYKSKELGIAAFEDYIQKSNSALSYSSKMATNFFDELVINLDKFTTYYDGNNLGEFGKYCSSNNKYYFVDFYIKELNLAIEFNGNYFHANPLIYNNDFKFYHTQLSAEEIREADKEKLNALLVDHDIKTIVVWESDLVDDKEKTINNLLHIITKYKNEQGARLSI